MQIPNCPEEQARASFSPSAWSQGEIYLANGAVVPGAVQYTDRGVELTAGVRRSARRSYQVMLTCGATGVCHCDCTCPFETRGGCAHCAAVVQLWCRRPDLFAGVGSAGASVPPPTRDMLAAASNEPPATVTATAPHAALWVAGDGTIGIDLEQAGARASLLHDTLGDYLTPVPDQHCITLSPLGFASALQQGVTVAQVFMTLAEVTAGAIPSAVTRQLNHWAAATDNLHLYDSLSVIEFADDFILPELLRVSGLRHYLVHIFSPRVIAVQPQQVPALVADLEARGYMPRVEPIAHER